MSTLQPIYIISVNTTPQRAKELVAILITDLSEQHNLVHVANTDNIEAVARLLEELVVVPQILICSSQWTVSQNDEIKKIAKSIIPEIKTIDIPLGLNAKKGGEAVMEFLKEQIIGLELPLCKKAGCKC